MESTRSRLRRGRTPRRASHAACALRLSFTAARASAQAIAIASLFALTFAIAGCSGGDGSTSSNGGGGSAATGGTGGAGGSTSTAGSGGTASKGQLAARLRVIDADESGPILGAPDAFTALLSPLDVSARLMDGSKTEPADYLAYAAAQARDWTPDERAACAKAVDAIDARLDELGLVLPAEPAEILLAKTTGAEEGSADGYTREGTIVLANGEPGTSQDGAELLAHEVFHVLTRANPKLSEDAHAILGFTPIPEVTLPDARKALRITNPDAPYINRQIHVTVAGADTPLVPLLQGNTPYMGGGLFNYLNVYLYDPPTDTAYTFDEVSGYYEQIGTTTSYNIHPEEISAEHFRLGLFGEPVNDPDLVNPLLALFH